MPRRNNRSQWTPSLSPRLRANVAAGDLPRRRQAGPLAWWRWSGPAWVYLHQSVVAQSMCSYLTYSESGLGISARPPSVGIGIEPIALPWVATGAQSGCSIGHALGRGIGVGVISHVASIAGVGYWCADPKRQRTCRQRGDENSGPLHRMCTHFSSLLSELLPMRNPIDRSCDATISPTIHQADRSAGELAVLRPGDTTSELKSLCRLTGNPPKPPPILGRCDGAALPRSRQPQAGGARE